MNLHTAGRLARTLMAEHNLQGWRFAWDRAVCRFGCCHHSTRTITLSRPLTSSEPDEQRVRNTILHEIAHALVGPNHGHNLVWYAKARAIGCDGRRCGTSEVSIERRTQGRCRHCGHTFLRHRRTRGAHHVQCRAKGVPALDCLIDWSRA